MDLREVIDLRMGAVFEEKIKPLSEEQTHQGKILERIEERYKIEESARSDEKKNTNVRFQAKGVFLACRDYLVEIMWTPR